MHKLLFSIAAILLLVALRFASAIDTVPQLNITQYTGRWYQAYGNPFVDDVTETNCKCVTADYQQLANGSVSVLNACRLKSPDGELNIIHGNAYRPNIKEQGKLKVSFGGSPPGGADYWVVQLGPATYQGNFYQYAVVTGPTEITLFVLARDIADFKANYETQVLEKLKEDGFDKFYNKPTETYQGTDCQYIPN